MVQRRRVTRWRDWTSVDRGLGYIGNGWRVFRCADQLERRDHFRPDLGESVESIKNRAIWGLADNRDYRWIRWRGVEYRAIFELGGLGTCREGRSGNERWFRLGSAGGGSTRWRE